ncbi:MAG: transcription antitermination factor NusB [Pseudomonadota bacterium]
MSQPRHRPRPQSGSKPQGLEARQGALALLDGVLMRGAMLDEATLRGDGAIRAEARGLADTTLRRLGQIDDLLARFVERPPKGSTRQILRLMVAELVFSGTAAHAAVDLAVRLARSDRKTERMAGLINAVGRRVAAEGAEIAAVQDAAALALPRWLAKAVAKDWGKDAVTALAEACLTPAPHDLTMTISADAAAMAQETGGRLLPTGSVRLAGRPQISTLPGFETGAWWVQDAAAALPARLLDTRPGERVLDLCAAPGGKTMQLAATGADVTAVDVSERRLERLAENLERTGLSAEILCVDALHWEPDAPFDAILLDAPCSATGTIRRHPDLPHRPGGPDLDALTALQDALLARAFGWLKPGGRLIYCTCSLLKREGETRVRHVLEIAPDAEAIALSDQDLPPEFINPQGNLRTLPQLWNEFGGLDGFFAAAIRRML